MSIFETPRRGGVDRQLGDNVSRIRRLEAEPYLAPAVLFIKVRPDTKVATSDGTTDFTFACSGLGPFGPDMDGMSLVEASMYVTTAGTGTMTVMVHNVTQGVDMLSTAMTIDSGELDSYYAATQPVIKTNGDEIVNAADQIKLQISVASTGKGLGVRLFFELLPEEITL